MKLSDHQAQTLFIVLGDTLQIAGGSVFTLSSEQRLKLYNDILMQQDHSIRELRAEPEE